MSSVRVRILMAFIGLTLATALLIGLYAVLNTVALKKQEYEAFLNAMADNKTASMREWINHLAHDLAYLEASINADLVRLLEGQRLAIPTPESEERVRQAMGEHFRLTQEFAGVFILDAQGFVALGSDPAGRRVYHGLQDFFREGMTQPGVHIPVMAYSSSGERLDKILAVRPIRDAKGLSLGVLCGQANLEQLNAIMVRRAGMGASGESYVVNSGGVLLTDSLHPGFTPGESLVSSPGVDGAIRARSDGFGEYADYRGVQVLGAWRWLPDLGAGLLVEVDSREAFAQAYTQGGLTLALALAVVLAMAVASFVVARTISAPLAALADHARSIRSGYRRLDDPVPFAARTDEVGLLASSFSEMTASLSEAFERQKREIASRRQAEEALRASKAQLSRLVDEQKNALERLALSERKYRTLIESTGQGYLLIDHERRIREVNESLATMLGYTPEELASRTVDSLIAPRDAKAFQAQVARIPTTRNREYDITVLTKDGRQIVVGVSSTTLFGSDGQVQGAFALISDLTQRLRMEEIMIQSEKMMTVGALAAGMAHEINNPLAGMLMSVQNILRRLSPDQPANLKAAREAGVGLEQVRDYLEKRLVMQFLEEIRQAGERATRIVRAMLAFARGSYGARAPCDLGQVAVQALQLVRSEYDLGRKTDFKRIKVETSIDQDLPPVLCSESEIEQVIVNLLKNAAQAMFDHPDPEREPAITVRVRAGEEEVLLSVEDNGPGMEESVRKRVFEPFFTTKPTGLGTGLGLSVSYFIVGRHGGGIEVESQPGRGSRFTVRLPVYRPDEREAPSGADAA